MKKEQSLLSFEADSRGRKWASALSEAGIPFSKLDDIKFRVFRETEHGYCFPSDRSLRKLFLDKVVSDKKAEMQAQLTETDIYLIFDETTNKLIEMLIQTKVISCRSTSLAHCLKVKILKFLGGAHAFAVAYTLPKSSL